MHLKSLCLRWIKMLPDMNTGWWESKWWTLSTEITNIHFKALEFNGPRSTSVSSLIGISTLDKGKLLLANYKDDYLNKCFWIYNLGQKKNCSWWKKRRKNFENLQSLPRSISPLLVNHVFSQFKNHEEICTFKIVLSKQVDSIYFCFWLSNSRGIISSLCETTVTSNYCLEAH